MNFNGNITVSISDKKPKPASCEPDGKIIPEVTLSKNIIDHNETKYNAPPTLTRNKCNKCNKKLKLTAFKCKCEHYYCNEHRYSDTHDCTFDYKKIGKEILKKNNPIILHKKLDKV